MGELTEGPSPEERPPPGKITVLRWRRARLSACIDCMVSRSVGGSVLKAFWSSSLKISASSVSNSSSDSRKLRLWRAKRL